MEGRGMRRARAALPTAERLEVRGERLDRKPTKRELQPLAQNKLFRAGIEPLGLVVKTQCCNTRHTIVWQTLHYVDTISTQQHVGTHNVEIGNLDKVVHVQQAVPRRQVHVKHALQCERTTRPPEDHPQ